VATFCFWTVFLLFLAGLCFLGLLAYTRNAGQAQPWSNSHSLGVLLASAAVVAVIAGICASHQHHHHHH
jgi:Na+/proline symporter